MTSDRTVTARWLKRLSDGSGCVEIGSGKTVCLYYLVPIKSDWGKAFKLYKYGSGSRSIEGVQEVYNVCLDGVRSICECKGFLKWNHCKHIDGVEQLLKEEE